MQSSARKALELLLELVRESFAEWNDDGSEFFALECRLELSVAADFNERACLAGNLLSADNFPIGVERNLRVGSAMRRVQEYLIGICEGVDELEGDREIVAPQANGMSSFCQ